MGKLTIDLPELASRRLVALALTKGTTVEALATQCVEEFAAAPSTRQAILKSRGASALAELGWLAGYFGQAVDELLLYDGTEDSMRVMHALEQAIEQHLAEHGQGKRTGVEATILAVLSLQREVGNGGYDQFFRNSSRKYSMGIVDCLIRIGCKQTAKVTRKALSSLKLGRAWTFKDLDEAMKVGNQKRCDALQACDEEFWKLTEIPDRLLKYAKANTRGILKP